jgi:hypothetical protein
MEDSYCELCGSLLSGQYWSFGTCCNDMCRDASQLCVACWEHGLLQRCIERAFANWGFDLHKSVL